MLVLVLVPQGGLGDAGYHPVPSAQPAKMNCSGVAVAEDQAAIVDIAYWKVRAMTNKALVSLLSWALLTARLAQSCSNPL